MNARGEVIGGIGASTGTPAQDQEVVTAGKEAIEEHLKIAGAVAQGGRGIGVEQGGKPRAKL